MICFGGVKCVGIVRARLGCDGVEGRGDVLFAYVRLEIITAAPMT